MVEVGQLWGSGLTNQSVNLCVNSEHVGPHVFMYEPTLLAFITLCVIPRMCARDHMCEYFSIIAQ